MRDFISLLKKSLILVLILAFVLIGFGQSKKNPKYSKYVVKQSFPSVYVAFVKKEERKNEYNEKEKIVWLRFQNNTKWKIILNASGGFGKNDVTLFYEILDDEFKVLKTKSCHVCSRIWLPSGKNALFTIPAEYLKKSASIRISYSYEWEGAPYSSIENEPEHYVYFKTPDFLK